MAVCPRDEKGEIVVLPSKIKPVIHFGKIIGDYEFCPDNDNPYYHAHQVDWFACDILRTAFDQDILYSFGAFMTICRIKQEDRIKAVIHAHKQGKKVPQITLQEPQDDEEAIEALVIKAIDEAVIKLIETREEEGKRLQADLISKLDGMIENVKFITDKSPVIVAEYKEKITNKIHELLEDSQIDESRIAQEVIVFADKVCVDEELVRLDSHIKAMREDLLKGETVGRRLDFIAQEMNREANTTLSKTSDPEISDHAIMLKTDIEKVREQIQNIE